MTGKNLFSPLSGLLLIFFSVAMIFLLEPWLFLVIDKIEASIINMNSSLLVLAAGLYSLIKTAAALPLLMGSLIISNEAVNKLFPDKINRYAEFAVNLMIIASIYYLVLLLTENHPGLYVPLIMTCFLFFTATPGHKKLWVIHRCTTTAQLLLGCYWLDLSPSLGAIGVGKDEVAVSMKLAATFLQSAAVMDFISMSFFIPLVAIAFITSFLINNHYKELKHMEKDKQRENQLQQYRLQLVQARSLQEMHSLVHDLKTPLTTINGLCSLLEMKYGQDAKNRQYFHRIDRSVQNMNEMISEILYENIKREITISDLINYVRAQLVPEKMEQQLEFNVENPDRIIKVNRIRFARAMINLVENALEATRDVKQGKIRIITRDMSEETCFSVIDNGVGISTENLNKIWITGFSTKNTSGLGLSFVKKVVEDHGGEIEVSSASGIGTTFNIRLRGEDDWLGKKS
ncbi:HAMP domain-containing sensor histidine kinase [Desulfotruncus alcoholivorax]|uniref:HAMP domain-containing sensor histidine kinase n=1 Tax=Desulfotruncus alcoholivorax TaxID=265477 RepID=UPI000408C3AB|nr:HAMP domain-containing sensor histidine kinase [Desulfotruncus alcoholivorax]